MQYKILLTGKYTTAIDTFFDHLDNYNCITTSNRYDDICRHIEVFKPDLFVICLNGDDINFFKRVETAIARFSNVKIPVIIIGEDEECAEFQKKTGALADKEIHKPLSPSKIEKIISDLMKEKNQSNNDTNTSKATFPDTPKQSSSPRKKESEADKLLRILQSVDGVSVGKEDGFTSEFLPDETPMSLGEARQSSIDSIIGSTMQSDYPASDTPIPTRSLSDRKLILVIDDDALMLKVIKNHLHDKYDIATAKGGKIAYKFLEKKIPDLILLDYEMPDEDGPTVYKKLKEMPLIANIPILFLTGVSDKARIVNVLALKPQGYLLKPVDYDALIEAITPLLEG